jgi:hypothetical protein
MITRENSYKFKIGLNQIGVFCKRFQLKQKREKGFDQKNIKGPRGRASAHSRNWPMAHFSSLLNRYLPFLFLWLTGGSHH